MMARIFLSHSSRDAVAAAEMRNWLLAQGFDAPFLDFDKHSGIPPGADWEQVLYSEIERAQAILLLLTRHWQDSKWCFAEFTQARALGKPVLPVIAGPLVSASEMVATDVQALNLLGNRPGALEHLKQRLSEITLLFQGGLGWDPSRPPYPGLAALQEEDGAVYFGRDEEIRQVIERLNARRSLGSGGLLVILGASGAGKSSLLRAGVLPRLRSSGKRWVVPPPFRPERRPLDALALSLDQALGGTMGWQALSTSLRQALRDGRQQGLLLQLANDLRARNGANEATILLAIDQAEELFQQSDAGERDLLIHLLNAALGQDLPYQAVMTLRSDGLSALQAEDKLRLRYEQVSLAPLAMERIDQVILGPARVAGLKVEPSLVQRAVRDAGSGDSLPLLAFTLRELYDRSAPDHQLTASAYEALGDASFGLSPLENAVRAAAERALLALQPDQAQLQALRDAFVPGLVRVNEKGNYARQPQEWSEISPQASPLLKALVAARVLALREERGVLLVEVAHEALLSKWPLLRGWLDEDRQFLIDCRNLEAARREWQEAPAHSRDGLLLSGARLGRARSWLEERPQQLEPEVFQFVSASLAQEENQQRLVRARRQRLLAGMAALSALSLASGALALGQLWAARAAQARQFAALAEASLASSPTQAAIYALAALAQNNKPNHRLVGSLSVALANNSAVARVPLGQGPLRAVLPLTGGDHIALSDQGTLLHWHAGQSKSQVLDGAQPLVRALAKTEAGGWLSANRLGSLRRWIGTMPLGPAVAGGQRDLVSLTALPGGMALSGALDGSLRWWRDGQPVGAVQRTGLGAIWALLALPDGSAVVGGDRGLVQRWSPRGPLGPAISSGQGSVHCLASLGADTWVSGGEDGTVRLWRDGLPGERLGQRQFGAIKAITTLPGRRLAWISDGGTLVLWQADTQASSRPIDVDGTLSSLATADDGSFVSSGFDGSMAIWRWPRPPAWMRDSGQGSVHSLLVNRDGLLLSGGWDGTIRQWAGLVPAGAPLQTGQGPIRVLQQLHNGYLLIGGLDATLQVWDGARRVGQPIPTAQVGLRSLVVLADGDLISGDYGGRVRRWHKLKELQPVLSHGDTPVFSLAQLPEGDILSGDATGQLRRLRWPEWKGGALESGQRSVLSIAVIHGREWWTAGADGTLQRWRDHRRIGEPIPVERNHSHWRVVRLPSGELVSSSGSSPYLRKLVPPAVAIAAACQQLRNLPELTQSEAPANLAARHLCRRQLG
jgi:WD40 repeat protein